MTAPRRRSPFDRFWQWREKRLIELYGLDGDVQPTTAGNRGPRLSLLAGALLLAPLALVFIFARDIPAESSLAISPGPEPAKTEPAEPRTLVL